MDHPNIVYFPGLLVVPKYGLIYRYTKSLVTNFPHSVISTTSFFLPPSLLPLLRKKVETAITKTFLHTPSLSPSRVTHPTTWFPLRSLVSLGSNNPHPFSVHREVRERSEDEVEESFVFSSFFLHVNFFPSFPFSTSFLAFPLTLSLSLQVTRFALQNSRTALTLFRSLRPSSSPSRIKTLTLCWVFFFCSVPAPQRSYFFRRVQGVRRWRTFAEGR